MRAIRRFTVRPVLPEVLKPLGDLARNLRWCWHADTQDLFRSVDPQVWDSSGGDPLRLLADVSVERLQMLSTDKKFLKSLRMIQADLADYLTGDLWYQGYAAENPAAPKAHRLLLARSSASPRCCRSTPAVWASWPATTSRRPATSACRSSASACSTGRATSASR